MIYFRTIFSWIAGIARRAIGRMSRPSAGLYAEISRYVETDVIRVVLVDGRRRYSITIPREIVSYGDINVIKGSLINLTKSKHAR